MGKQGDIEEACICFEKAERLCPDCAPYLWQRGIARYYAAEFDAAAEQFASGQRVNSNDTEEVIWEMLSRSAAAGSGHFDSQYVMLSGKLSVVVEPRPNEDGAVFVFGS